MTKKVTITWAAVEGADGYFAYLSKFSNSLEFLGSFTDTLAILNNQVDTDVINFGVQAFKLETIGGVERRVFGPVSVVQINIATDSSQVFDGTAIEGFSIQQA